VFFSFCGGGKINFSWGRGSSSEEEQPESCAAASLSLLLDRAFLRFDGAQEKLDGASHALVQIVRLGEIHGPTADHGGVEAFHELSEVSYRKGARNFFMHLPFDKNLSQQADRHFLWLSHLRRAYGIHRPGEHDGPPEWSVRLHFLSHCVVHLAKPLSSGSTARELGLQVLSDAGKPAPAHFAKDRILAREISEEGRLADVQDLNDIVNSGVLVPVPAEQADRSIDNLLPQAHLLALAKPRKRPASRRFGAWARQVRSCRAFQPFRGVKAPWRRIGSSDLGVSHDSAFSWVNCTARRPRVSRDTKCILAWKLGKDSN
jgi:hypothetical protein